MDHTDRIRDPRDCPGTRQGPPDRRAAALLTRSLLTRSLLTRPLLTRPLLTRPLLALAALLAVLLPGVPAWAHNALVEASPAKNATVQKSPAGVKLRFLEKLNPDYTTITVSDAGKSKVAISEPKVAGSTVSVTFGAPLANGVYNVAYQVVSTDGHTVKNSYQFTVNDPAAVQPSAGPSAPPSLPPTTEPAAATSATTAPAAVELAGKSEESENSTLYGLIAGVVVALAAGAAVLFIRRRKA